MTPEQLLATLGELGIHTHTVSHSPVMTVDEARAHRCGLTGGFTKNLFVRNKKGVMWLIVADEDRRIDLKALGRELGIGRLSFASHARLERYLGVLPGAVTPFGLINDRQQQVGLILERSLLDHERLHFHPLDNRMTTAIGSADFLRFLESIDHPPRLVEL